MLQVMLAVRALPAGKVGEPWDDLPTSSLAHPRAEGFTAPPRSSSCRPERRPHHTKRRGKIFLCNRLPLRNGSLLVASLLWSAYGVRVRRSMLAPAHAASIVAVVSMCCFLPVYALVPHEALFTLGIRQL